MGRTGHTDGIRISYGIFHIEQLVLADKWVRNSLKFFTNSTNRLFVCLV